MRSFHNSKIIRFPNYSVIIDKKDSISTKQTSQSLARSNYNISSISKRNRSLIEQKNVLIQPPIEIYFNPEFRDKYVRKVIDGYLMTVDNSQDNNVQQKDKQKLRNVNKFFLRTKKIQSKRKTISISNFSQLLNQAADQNSNILQKSFISDQSKKDHSLAIIGQTTLKQYQSQQKQSFSNGFKRKSFVLSFKDNSISRPFTQYKTRSSIKHSQKQEQGFMSFSQLVNSTLSPISKISQKQSQKKLTFKNNYFAEYDVIKDGRIKRKQKKFIGNQNIFFKRQEKLSKRGIKSLALPINYHNTIEYPACKSVKEQLSQQFHYGKSQNDFLIQIYHKDFYNKLFLNYSQQLIDLITCITNFIIQNKGKVLTNAFKLDNLYRIDEKIYLLKDLSKSAIVDEIKIREKYIINLLPPILFQQKLNQWTVEPQYLSPQILTSSLNNDFQWIKHQPQKVMASQIWCLGCMLVELLTLIPLNQNTRCKIKNDLNIYRAGYLSMKIKGKQFNYENLMKKQVTLFSVLSKNLQKQLSQTNVDKRILEIVKNMLRYDNKQRIKPEQILLKLKRIRQLRK